MRESRPPGSVRGAPGNGCPYRDAALAEPVPSLIQSQLRHTQSELDTITAQWAQGRIDRSCYRCAKAADHYNDVVYHVDKAPHTRMPHEDHPNDH